MVRLSSCLTSLVAAALACAPVPSDDNQPVSPDEYVCEPLNDDVETDVYAGYRGVLEQMWLSDAVDGIVVREQTDLRLDRSEEYWSLDAEDLAETLADHELVDALRDTNAMSVGLEAAAFEAPFPLWTIDDDLFEQLAADGHQMFMQRLESIYAATPGVFVFSRPAFNCSRSRALLWLELEAVSCSEERWAYSLRKQAGTWQVDRAYHLGRRAICD